MKRIRLEAFAVTDLLTGTTANAYADALDWDTQAIRDKTMVLKNEDGANGLKYKVLIAAHIDGNLTEQVGETALAAGETALIQYVKPYAKIVIQVKSSFADNHAPYQIDYIGSGI